MNDKKFKNNFSKDGIDVTETHKLFGKFRLLLKLYSISDT